MTISVTFEGANSGVQAANIYGGVNNYTHVHYHGGAARDQCLRDPAVTDPREDKARIESDEDSLLKQCYSWILNDASFQRWRAKGDTRLLWIKGDPGKGKTMMTIGLIDELSCEHKSSTAMWKKLI
jgi:hypothetical protein